MPSNLCITCKKREPQGYVIGTGEYLKYTCLYCYRRSKKQPNFIESSGGRLSQQTAKRTPPESRA